jgi:hypothetical protein
MQQNHLLAGHAPKGGPQPMRHKEDIRQTGKPTIKNHIQRRCPLRKHLSPPFPCIPSLKTRPPDLRRKSALTTPAFLPEISQNR